MGPTAVAQADYDLLQEFHYLVIQVNTKHKESNKLHEMSNKKGYHDAWRTYGEAATLVYSSPSHRCFVTGPSAWSITSVRQANPCNHRTALAVEQHLTGHRPKLTSTQALPVY